MSRQSLSPADGSPRAELILATHTELDETVVLATKRMLRLSYRITRCASTLTMDGGAPAPWAEAPEIAGHGFEIILTERGAMVIPAHGPRLPDQLAVCLSAVSEDVRCAWPAIPDALAGGSSWSGAAIPAVAGATLAAGTSTSLGVTYRAVSVTGELAELRADFAFKPSPASSTTGALNPAAAGGGSMIIHIDRRAGPLRATRTSRLAAAKSDTPVGVSARVVESTMELVREPARDDTTPLP